MSEPTVLRGEIAGHPVLVVLPADFTGKVSLVLNLHRGHVAREIRVVREESQRLKA